MDTKKIYSENTKVFFEIVMQGLKGMVDADYFWDAVDENAAFEFCYDIPGFTGKFDCREDYRKWFEGYNANLTSADGLRVYKADSGVVILEYAVHGTAANSKKPYNNRFCSIITIKNQKIVYWRDYMDTLAVMRAT